jgi:hypothetical protein
MRIETGTGIAKGNISKLDAHQEPGMTFTV